MERRKVSPNLRDRVSDDPTALVKPKILGTEALGTRGQLNPPLKFKRGKAMPKSLLILILSLNFEPIQKSGAARQKYRKLY